MAAKKKVAIIILNYNGRKDTLACLDSIKKLQQQSIKAEAVVVDNGSSDGSVEAIRFKFPDIRIIENKENLGFCEGNNLGAKAAFGKGADFALILNNDTLVHPELVDRLVQAAEEQNADVVSPKIYFAPGFEFHLDRYKDWERGKVIWYAGGLIDWSNVLPSHRGVDEVDHGKFDAPSQTQFVTGCATLVSRKVFETIGLYDPIFFAYFEDADFSLRAKKNGFKVLYAPQAILWHKNAASFGGSGSPFQDYFITRNRLIFGIRHAPVRAKFALCREAIKLLMKGPSRKRRAIIDALSRRIPDVVTIR